MTSKAVKIAAELLRFVATWLQQPTVIEVADSVEAKSARQKNTPGRTGEVASSSGG